MLGNDQNVENESDRGRQYVRNEDDPEGRQRDQVEQCMKGELVPKEPRRLVELSGEHLPAGVRVKIEADQKHRKCECNRQQAEYAYVLGS